MKLPDVPSSGFFVAAYMRKKFPSKSNAELELLWDSSYNWLCRQVDRNCLEDEPSLHPLMLAAMFLYMQHVCETNAQKKQAHIFSAQELLAIFPK